MMECEVCGCEVSSSNVYYFETYQYKLHRTGIGNYYNVLNNVLLCPHCHDNIVKAIAKVRRTGFKDLRLAKKEEKHG